MPRRKLIPIIIFSLILLGFIGGFGYWYLKIQRPNQAALNFIQQNLKQDFWPLEIQLKTIEIKNGKGLSAAWNIKQDNFTLLIKPFNKKENYNLAVFIPEQKKLDPDSATEIFKDYFLLFPEKFDCLTPEVPIEEEIISCRSRANKKFIELISYKRLDVEDEGTYISISAIK